MKIQNLFTSGKMNKDLDERLIPQGEYRDALNVKVANSNGSDVGAIENDLSNEVLTSLDFGTNPVCIGAVADDKNRKIYWFVKSETGSYIAEYSEFTNTSAFVLKDTRASGSNVLNFKKHKIITGVNILINDNENKIFIYWTDGENPPRYLEVSEAKAYGENNFAEVDISVIKAPPRIEPSISLQIDGTLDDNYIEDKFFTFAYRYKYKHNKYSALSPFSEVAFFPNEDTFKDNPYATYAMTNKYNSVQITYNSGPSQVLEIEVYAKEENSSNNYLIGRFNKQNDTLSNNTNYQLTFNNNKIYKVLSETQYNRVYDNVPLKAVAQDFLGNRIIYGNYEENYDIAVSVDITPSIESTELVPDCSSNVIYTVQNTTSENITYNYILCSEVDYRQAIAKPGTNRICAASVQSQAGLTITAGNSCAADYSPRKTLKSNRNYVVGLVYFDSNGRKSSVIADEKKYVNVPFESSDKANVLKVTINSFAPSWADRYKIAVKEVKRPYIALKASGVAYLDDDNYLYIQIDEKEKHKVSDGSKIVPKTLGVISFNDVDTYEVETVDFYEGSVAGSPGTPGEITWGNGVYSNAIGGLYMKLRGDGLLTTLTGLAQATSSYRTFEVLSESEQDSVYYEIPGTYEISNGYHSGNQQNQDLSLPAIIQSQAFNAFTFGYGVESNRIKDDLTLNTFNLGVRLNEVIELYKSNKRIASLTYSDVYEESTSYNGLNVFNLSQVNYKDIDEKYGEIKKLHSRDNDLIVFQENKIHNILFNKNILYTASGDGSVSQTLSVLGQEVPYTGEYGISSSPESFQSWGSRMYFSDERRSAVLRLSQDGISEISDYGMRSWFNDNLNKNLNVRGVGGYDPINDQYVISIQDIPIEWREDTYECIPQTTTTTTSTTTTTTSTTTTTTAAPATTTTAAPGTTTTTQPPAGSYDCNTVTWASASFDCNTGAISVTPNYGSVTIHSYSPTSATQNSGVVTITYTFSDSNPAWDNTGTQITCTNLSVDTNCITTTSTTTSTTTTTTAAPITTTTTTAAPITTTTQAPVTSYFYLKYCSNDQDVYCGGVRQTLSDNTSTWGIGNSFFNSCVNECTYLSSSASSGSSSGNVDGSTVTRNNSCATCS